MTALITVSNSDGVVGRCDAKCYNAQTDECDCICGGMNHGAGLERAMENVTEHFLGESLETFADKHGLDASRLSVSAQSQMFPYGNEPTTTQKKREARRRR